MKGKTFWVILAAIAVFTVGVIVTMRETPEEKTGVGEETVNSPGSANFYGKEGSPVTLIEYVDFQCEACLAYYPYVKQLKENYQDRVRFQVKYLPGGGSHQFSKIAVYSAEAAARQGKFWEMHDKLFDGQKEWEQTPNAQTTFDKYAKDLGLDMAKFKSDYKSNEVKAVVEKDLSDAKQIKAQGTPTFVLNGVMIENPGSSYEALAKVLDDALAKAQQEQK